jgi:hypothetical protein
MKIFMEEQTLNGRKIIKLKLKRKAEVCQVGSGGL